MWIPFSHLTTWNMPIMIFWSTYFTNEISREVENWLCIEFRLINFFESQLSSSWLSSSTLSVGFLGKAWVQLLIHSNKTPRSPTLSTTGCEAACSLTQSDCGALRTQMSTLRGTEDLILLLTFNVQSKHLYGISTYIPIYTSQLVLPMCFA